MMVAIVSVSLVSCGGDDDDNGANGNGSNGNGTDNLEAQIFVGYWHSENAEYDFLFNEDGSCIAFANWNTAPKSGRWSYDKNSKKLTTTIGGNNWLINVNSSNYWAGINMGSYATVEYYPSDLHFLWRSCLIRYKWNEVNGDDSFSFSFDQVQNTTDSYIQLYGYNDYGYDMSFIMGFYKPVRFDLGWRWVVDGFDVDPTYANMKIENCKRVGDKFTATFSQTVEYNCSIAYHEEWEYNGEISSGETKWTYNESKDESTGLTMTVTDLDKSNPVITIEHAKSGYKATYKGIKK